MVDMNDSVTKFLDDLNHPLRVEIEELRAIILSSSKGLAENIKWNGPNYCFEGQDRITMRIQPPRQIQLVFHRGAKVIAQPNNKLIEDQTGILIWKANDRALTAFKNLEEIGQAKSQIVDVIDRWIEAAK